MNMQTTSIENRDKVWSVLCHASLVFFPLLLPLLVYLIKDKSPFVEHHAKEAFMFHVGVLVALFASKVLMLVLIGFLLFPLVALSAFILTVWAVIQTWNGQWYSYPVTGRWARKI